MRGRRVDVSIEDMLRLRRAGYSNIQIADQLEVSPQTVYNYIGPTKQRRVVGVQCEENKFLFRGHCDGCVNIGPGCGNCVRNKFLADNYKEG